MDAFFITTPIYYVNAEPHLGHAYTTIVADSLIRFHKMLGDRTLFLTGTDEHGDKIVQAAEKNNVSPREFVDRISASFKALWPHLSIYPDYFTRTTDKTHIEVVQKFLQKIYDAGDIYFGEFGGHYCYGCERFYTEKELENGLCPQHQTRPEFIKEKNYFFRMSKYLPWLKEYLEEHADLIEPQRFRNEVMGMLESGDLEDLCISRPKSRLEWGIPLPFDSNYVCYVWFDALLSYLGDLDWPNGAEYKTFWPGSHLIAKDILKPHAVFWPCMLKAANIPVYKHLYVHGYWLIRDTKMSKSLGNIVKPLEMREKFGLDAFRYFLLRDMRFGADANFGEEALITRINADLANDLGNLFSRVLSMLAKYFNSCVPEQRDFTESDEQTIMLCGDTLSNYCELFGRLQFSHALENLWVFIRSLNVYVDREAPWRLHKENNIARLGAVMNLLLACMRKIAIILWPVMPDASQKMLEQLGEKCAQQSCDNPPVADLQAFAKVFECLPAGQKLAAASNIFPRIDTRQTETSEKKPAQDYIDITLFKSMDLRAGIVKEAKKHPDADKLLILIADFGEAGIRQIVSGIASDYEPDQLGGMPVCALLNLPPRKIRGIESQGMILTVENGNHVSLLSPPADTRAGGRIS